MATPRFVKIPAIPYIGGLVRNHQFGGRVSRIAPDTKPLRWAKINKYYACVEYVKLSLAAQRLYWRQKGHLTRVERAWLASAATQRAITLNAAEAHKMYLQQCGVACAYWDVVKPFQTTNIIRTKMQ